MKKSHVFIRFSEAFCVFAALLIFLTPRANAQTEEGPDWSGKVYQVGRIYPGYYVTNEGDTVNGYFYHGNQVQNQTKCNFYTKETDTKPTKTFGVQDISAWKVADKMYRSIHFSGGLFEKPLRFNLVMTDGEISQYIFYSEDNTGETYDVFLKQNDPANSKPVTLQYFGLSFSKKMSEYVADYPELSKKIAGKEDGYGLTKLFDIIAEYNKWYASKQK